MNVEQLKNSILQLAIQGKLVEQREEEGTAEELYQQIQLEKNQLIKEGKVKKSKPLPPIDLDEVPFEIPASWKWIRVGSIFQHNTGKTLNNKSNEGQFLDYITTSNLFWNNFKLDNLKKMYFKESELKNFTATKGDLLVIEGGDYGRAAIWKMNYDIRFQNHIHRLRPFLDASIEYFYYLFHFYKNVGWIEYKGIGIKGLSSSTLASMVFPLPPLSEQERIVDKIEELMPLIEEYGESYVKLEELNKSFPQDIKQSILQYAIQGKLVEQREEEGTAEELYQQIQLEKNQLIKEGKVKKSKPLPPIDLDEVPFEIPATWKWLRLAQVSTLIRPEKISNERLEYFEARVLRGQKAPEIKLNGDVVDVGEYVILVDGENSGEVFKILKRGYIGSTFKRLFYFSKINEDYLIAFLRFYKKTFSERKIGAAIPHLNKTLFNNLPFPLPPYNEQQRIVDKIEELLSITKALEGEIQ